MTYVTGYCITISLSCTIHLRRLALVKLLHVLTMSIFILLTFHQPGKNKDKTGWLSLYQSVKQLFLQTSLPVYSYVEW